MQYTNVLRDRASLVGYHTGVKVYNRKGIALREYSEQMKDVVL